MALAGWLAHAIHYPLAWMLGPALVGLLLAFGGLTVPSDGRLGDIGRGILGAGIGGSLQVQQFVVLAREWELIVLVVAYVTVAGGVGAVWFIRGCGWSPRAAIYAALPGGLSEMVESARQQGVDVRPVALAHTLRVFLLVSGVSLLIVLTQFVNLDQASFGTAGPRDIGLLLLLVPAGVWLGRAARIPAPSVLGPMIVAAVAGIGFGWHMTPPIWALTVAQALIGWSLARRFAGSTARQTWISMRHVVGQLMLILPVWVASVALGLWLTALDGKTLMLSLAPGGQAEMALLAWLIGADASYVVILHLLRVVLVVVGAGLFIRLALHAFGTASRG
ncbi:hypothetical protein GH975_07675 [Litorivicinus lipolyticus]|uniref:Ammonia monooxygenase n=1 Tax=Litorivicinus lipolyticus TaxID=418701 RepID=A0A5Q2Q8I5_9GAMM|nr:AbrB family transcriptional regulator [Litorivicinus lipolyticus]QGG80458.1 hypothetical protein GH975_07675 [Litorivicinus lipolyticus]